MSEMDWYFRRKVWGSDFNSMIHKLVCILSLIWCKNLSAQTGNLSHWGNTITAGRLSDNVYYLASAEMNGRATGSSGEGMAERYVVRAFTNAGLDPAGVDGYLQYFPVDADSVLFALNLIQGHAYLASKGIRSEPITITNDTGFKKIQVIQLLNRSANVIGIVPGEGRENEYVVVTAHYDHLGRSSQGLIYYGADDNASGVAALLEVSRVCSDLVRSGRKPKRTIVFIATSGEEFGYWGSKYYTEYPIFPLENTSACLNMDMIGRIDKDFKGNKDSANYVYVLGSKSISSELPAIVESVNRRYSGLVQGPKFDDPKKYLRKLYASDQKSFLLKNVPILFLSDGYAQDSLPTDYHQASDTPDKINYELLARRVRFGFYLTWEIANRKELLKRDLP